MAHISKKDHDDAIRLLAWDRRGEIELSEGDRQALNLIASNFVGGDRVMDANIFRLNELTERHAGFRPLLEMIATSPDLRHHRYLTPSAAWTIVDRMGSAVATFSAPQNGNEMLTGPSDLIGEKFKTREDALLAVSSRI